MRNEQTVGVGEWTLTSNLDQTLCSKSEQKISFMTKPQLPNLQQTVAIMILINISNSVEWPILQADYSGSKQQRLVKDFLIYYVIHKVGLSHVYLHKCHLACKI